MLSGRGILVRYLGLSFIVRYVARYRRIFSAPNIRRYLAIYLTIYRQISLTSLATNILRYIVMSQHECHSVAACESVCYSPTALFTAHCSAASSWCCSAASSWCSCWGRVVSSAERAEDVWLLRYLTVRAQVENERGRHLISMAAVIDTARSR